MKSLPGAALAESAILWRETDGPIPIFAKAPRLLLQAASRIDEDLYVAGPLPPYILISKTSG
jgi:hypothetical protein